MIIKKTVIDKPKVRLGRMFIVAAFVDAFAAISIAIGFLVLYANPLAINGLAEAVTKALGA